MYETYTVPWQLGPHGGEPVLPRRPLVGGGATAAGVAGGRDGLPLDRRLHGAAQDGGLDTPPGEARSGMLPDEGRPLAGNESQDFG